MDDRDSLQELFSIVSDYASLRNLPLTALALPFMQAHFGMGCDVYYRRRLSVCRTLIDLHLPISAERLDILLTVSMVHSLPVDKIPAGYNDAMFNWFSPETRIGLSAPGYVPENDIAALARTLAGRPRPYVRWWGARYGNDEPLDTPSYLFAAQWSAENVGEGIENVYESDIYPHSGYYASAARMTAFMSQMMAYGLDGVYHWVPRQTQWNEFPDYLGEYRASAPRLWAIRDEAKKGRSVGLCAAYDPCCRIRHELQAFAPGRVESSHAVAMAFGRLGFPLTTRAASVTAYATHYAFDGKSDADIEKILSGNVFLDGAAAEVLTERGFASLIGVEAKDWTPPPTFGMRTSPSTSCVPPRNSVTVCAA